jgi:ribosomal protein S18 acetylase RimI-like enzyme
VIVIVPWKKDMGILAQQFSVSPDHCENPSYFEEYLRWRAPSDKATGRNFVYVALVKNDQKVPTAIAGYVAIRASAFIQKEENYACPAVEITQLAMDKRYEGRGIGKALVYKALEVAASLAKKTLGVRYVVLRATKQACDFYLQPDLGFNKAKDVFSDVPIERGSSECEPMYIPLNLESKNMGKKKCDV